MPFLKITNSKFYHIKVTYGYSITISECEFDQDVRLDSIMIDVENSILKISNSTFNNIKAVSNVQTIISIVSSQVTLKNVQCSGIEATISLIQIINGSELRVESSLFMKNRMSSSIIVTKLHSRVSVTDSVFSDNVAMYGSCILASANTTLNIHNSSFLNNEAIKGGAIMSHNMLHLCEQNDSDSTFGQKIFDKLTKKTEEGLTPDISKTCLQNKEGIKYQAVGFTAFITESVFVNNTAWKGGAIYATGDAIELFIEQSNFISLAYLGGGNLFINGTTKMGRRVHATGSSFSTPADVNAGSLYMENTFLNITNCSIGSQDPNEMGYGIWATENSIIYAINNTFYCLTPVTNALNMYNNVTLYIMNCTFLLGSPFQFPLILARQNSSITVFQSHFTNNNTFLTVLTSIVFDIRPLTNITVTNSTFASPRGLGLRVISATDQSHAVFKNCSFNTVSGFELFNLSSLHMRGSKITGCINTM